MVDFRKLLADRNGPSTIDPRALFQTLPRSSKFEYLHDVQGDVLDEWHQRRDKRDVVIKMNTGSGKTLVGLLILWSKIKEGRGPALYLCPDNYLVAQVLAEAKELGIKSVSFESDNQFPLEFTNGESILVTTVHKLINGRSIFGVSGSGGDFVPVGSVLVDDAHACINEARGQFTARFSRDHPIAQSLVTRFSESLRSQSPALWADIEGRSGGSAVMQIPYWVWNDHLDQVAQLLSEHQNDPSLRFVWPFLRSGDLLRHCVGVISDSAVEIAPSHLPIDLTPSFHRANHRVCMSATLVDDAALIKDFRTELDAVKGPIRPKVSGDIGERLILTPRLIDAAYDEGAILSLVNQLRNDWNLNVVVLVPSNKAASIWEKSGALLATSDTIHHVVSRLEKNRGQFVVLANRYDGIDLEEDACRVLVIDGLPSEWNLLKLNEARVREGSPIIRREQAQKIEQGLGRAVRSQKDHCVVLLMRNTLISFVSRTDNLGFFTPDTRQQLELGQRLAMLVREEAGKDRAALAKVIEQCLARDSSWQEYHRAEIQNASRQETNTATFAIAEYELNSWLHANSGQHDKALAVLEEMLDAHTDLATDDRGWYLQVAASYQFHVDRSASMQKQAKAHELNNQLLKPPAGVRYAKLLAKQTTQAAAVHDWMNQFTEPNALAIEAERIVERAHFGVPADEFEDAFKRLAWILGFQSQRPEQESGAGPDVLWRLADGSCFVIEAKNERGLNLTEIHKSDAEQIDHSERWFSENYPGEQYTPILIHPTSTLAKESWVSNDCRIMTPGLLQTLTNRIRSFTTALSSKPITHWKVEEIASHLAAHMLTPNNIRQECLTPAKRKPN